ncbi:MAG: hypothetical protein A2644_01125 [Candidatus Zambryskibacteria bacterium RIFCSPHIGHO2_01_FULL_39_63]|nr:MAG: hypothetical protein A2644_01125 [Candidatus Zambryskibacteria bacterium RIFCSPHIGHO2_01_FULL_39_63]OHA99197.1 MAG: hypothetical protein A3F20_03340 [Candidatus Zambryskibacteria bacterium RIFCSPHIGHO2_12_FULL_39_21]
MLLEKIMPNNFWVDVLSGAMTSYFKQRITDKAFEAGKNGQPPPQYSILEVQQISDNAYSQGQKSVLVDIGNKVAKRE